MFFIPTWEKGHLGCSIQKNSGLILSKYKADTFDMIQNALEDKNMHKATVYELKEKRQNGECWQNKKMSEQEKSTNLKVSPIQFARLLMSFTSAMVLHTKL